MMRVVCSSLLFSLFLCPGTNAFVPVQQRSSIDGRISLSAAGGIDRVKSVGGGIPVVPAGDRRLFDPAVQGKLGGTDDCDERIRQGHEFSYLTAHVALEPPPGATLLDTQHWLEDIGLPQNTYKPKSPTTATVLGRAPLISQEAPGDIQHVVLQLPQGMHYVEGQSLSVIPPGTDDNNKPHKPRLYSIASTRYGDLLDGNTVSLCVRRAEYYDPVTNQVDASKKGVCSNFLCDAQAGDVVSVAGPVGKTMLLPEDPTKDIIMVATGTGIAPFRGFLHRLFVEQTAARHMFQAKAWLILGVPVTGGLLYHDELQAMQAQLRQDQLEGKTTSDLEVTFAISREMTNAQGGKLYVQDVLAQRADELFGKLNNGAVIYFCGLKGMMPGILQAMEQVALARGMDWNTKLKEWQDNHQWHVEVY